MGPGVTSVNSLPPAFLTLNYGNLGSLSPTTIAVSDSAIEVKVNAFGTSGQTIDFELPPFLLGTSGIPLFGTMMWFSTASPVVAGAMHLNLGFLQAPSFASTASNQAIPVGAIDINIGVEFAVPTLE
jgi:hypothetical protein